MKGNEKILEKLNFLLASELTAINQYMVHSEICENWHYDTLAQKIKERAIMEMKHAEKLIARILFLEGVPIVSKLNDLHIGIDILNQIQNDWQAEDTAIKDYNEGIRLAMELSDNGSREIFDSNLKEEEEHIDFIEGQLTQIKQMGIANYLSEQMDD